MSVNRLDAGTTPISAGTPDAASAGSQGRPATPGSLDLPEGASAGTAADNLRAVADTLGIDPADLLAQLTAASAGDGGPSTGAAGTADTDAPPSPAAAAAAALLKPDHPAHAWTGDLTQHRGGLLVDISV